MHLQSNTLTNRYGSIAAEIYDIDKPLGAMPDTEFHLARLVGINDPILEPACGSGRTLVPLLEAGHRVSGFDTSAEMLERCAARCAERGFSPDLSRRSFEDFHYDHAFAAIVVPVGTFGLIDDFVVALEVLKRFREHLAPGGLLAIDVQPISALAASGEDRRSWVAPNGDLLTIDGRRMKVDWFSQREERWCRYERWRDNALIETQLEPMALRYWSAPELTFALREAGFGEITVIGGYDRRRSPRSGDRTLTFEAIAT